MSPVSHASEAASPQDLSDFLLQLETSLNQLSDPGQALLAFDADGTLWTGDIGSAVFHEFCRNNWLKEAALPHLNQLLRQLNLSAESTASLAATRLFQAYSQGIFDERQTCAMMTTCYAGFELSELQSKVRHFLHQENFADNQIPESTALKNWAALKGLSCVIVTASPHWLVSLGLEAISWPPYLVLGAECLIKEGIISADEPAFVPYAEGKWEKLRKFVGCRRILAAFGDSHFDLQLLLSAEYGRAIRPKASLLASLPFNESLRILSPL